mgnify:CR=1 FL=1
MREEIIKMAEICGIPEFENNESQADNIIRFFHMAQAAEREACAKLCEEGGKDESGRIHVQAWGCAKAIRARKEN